MSADDTLQDSTVFSSTRKDVGYADPEIEPARMTVARGNRNKRTPGTDNSSAVTRLGSGPPLLKTLQDAEAAANSAVGQLAFFKDTMENMFALPFAAMNKPTSVRQQVKGGRGAEAHRAKRDKMIESLLKKGFSQAENEKLHAKGGDGRASAASSAVHATRCDADTYARLQWQLRKKEGEIERLTVQLQTLKRTLVERKMDIGVLKYAISSMSGKASESNETLEAQKKRVERFEVAVGKCFSQLREKDVQLANAVADRDSWRTQKRLLEQKLAQSEAALDAEKAVSREEKRLHEKYLRQLAEFRDEVDTLRTKYECLLKQIQKKDASSEVPKIRQDMNWQDQGHRDAPRVATAERCGGCKCQVSVPPQPRRPPPQRKYPDKSEATAAAAAAAREVASLQNKVRELEAEKRIRDTEVSCLQQNKLTAEKQHDLLLKDLRLRLDRSESQNKSLQGYVDYLKKSFDEVFV